MHCVEMKGNQYNTLMAQVKKKRKLVAECMPGLIMNSFA